MAIVLNDLMRLYDPNNFDEISSPYKLTEKQCNKEKLSEVYVSTSGKGLFIKPDFLNKSKEIYLKVASDFSFKDINDGTFILEKDGKHYIVYTELKSGYKAVPKKAIEQIPVSSIKIKSFLRNMKSYHPEEYVEVGLIISYPPTKEDQYDNKNNSMVLDQKMSYIEVQQNGCNSLDRDLRKSHQALLEAAYFPKLNQDLLHEDIQFKSMMIYYFPVHGNGETINLDSILH